MYIFRRDEAKGPSFTAGLKCKAVTHALVFKQSGHYLSWHMGSEQRPGRTIITIIYKSAKPVIIRYSVLDGAKRKDKTPQEALSTARRDLLRGVCEVAVISKPPLSCWCQVCLGTDIWGVFFPLTVSFQRIGKLNKKHQSPKRLVKQPPHPHPPKKIN